MNRKPRCQRCNGAGSINRPGPRRRKVLTPIMACPECGGTGHPLKPEICSTRLTATAPDAGSCVSGDLDGANGGAVDPEVTS